MMLRPSGTTHLPQSDVQIRLPILLILDEWLLMKPTQEEQQDIFELLHHRRKRSSTIFCSQYSKDDRYEQLGGASPIADAIRDRIVHDGYVINIVPVVQACPDWWLTLHRTGGSSASEYSTLITLSDFLWESITTVSTYKLSSKPICIKNSSFSLSFTIYP